MIKNKPRIIYQANLHGVEQVIRYSLTEVLQYIGKQCKGEAFGSMLITAKHAQDKGFTISQYREFL